MNANRVRRAALYVRVSTDRQTVENQIAKLTQVPKARGWDIVATFTDAGISGAKGRKDRPGLDDMLKQAPRQIRCGHGLGDRSRRSFSNRLTGNDTASG